jgi:hypothetical protein
MLWFTQKLLFVFVFLTISDPLYMVLLYTVNTIFDLFILNEITVKPIDSEDIAKILEMAKK